MKKPALLVLAAGMGSRYGGLKQIDPLGPNGEIIIDYSVHDAILAGFGKVVCVIKEEMRQDFEEKIGSGRQCAAGDPADSRWLYYGRKRKVGQAERQR